LNRVQNNGSSNLGIILKLKKNRVIVMTDKLDFIEVYRKPGMIRGQKVYFNSFDLCESSLWFFNYKKVLKFASAAASVAAIFVMLFVGYRFLSPVDEYAYIDIDINPSVEMTIDKDENVLKAQALNSEGQTLLDAVKVKNTVLVDAVSLLLNKSKEIGYINSDNNEVIVTTSVNSKKASESKSKDLEAIISSLKEVADKSGVESQIIEISPEDRKEAKETGISMGKYYIYSKAKDEGIDITIEEVKNSSVSVLLNKVTLLDDTDMPHTQNPNTEPTSQPTQKPTSTQSVENSPAVTATSSVVTGAPVTSTPTYTSVAIITATPSLISDSTPSPTASNVTRPSVTSYRTITPEVRTPSPKPSITATPSRPTNTVTTQQPFPVFTPTKTPKPLFTATKSPTPTPKPTKPKVTVTTSVTINTPVKKTPTPTIVSTPTPITTIMPTITSSQLPTPTDKPTPVPTIKSTPTSVPTHTPTPTQTPISTPTATLTPISTPTVTPTYTPKSTPTPTLTPTPPTTTIPTATPTGVISMKLGMYNEERASNAKEIHPRFKLINNGNTAIKLSNIRIRYYYTIDIEDKHQKFYCDWSDIGRDNVTGKFVKMNSSENDADYYLEIGFDSTESLEPGSNIEIACRIGPDNTIGDGSEFYNQLNDYSFNGTARDFVSWDKVTVFVSSFILWGDEP
jgi:hypothetical protein